MILKKILWTLSAVALLVSAACATNNPNVSFTNSEGLTNAQNSPSENSLTQPQEVKADTLDEAKPSSEEATHLEIDKIATEYKNPVKPAIGSRIDEKVEQMHESPPDPSPTFDSHEITEKLERLPEKESAVVCPYCAPEVAVTIQL